tara:strand:- start:80 stop:319 length:240 start_codon:yes stop_codon:yes gene_type:complete
MNRFYRALEAKYQADIEEALAVVDLYFNKSVGVGEHPDVLAELDKYMGLLESSMGKLETLKKIFNATDNTEAAPAVSDK